MDLEGLDRELAIAIGRARIGASADWLGAEALLPHERDLLCERLELGEHADLRDARLTFLRAFRRPPLYALKALAPRSRGSLRYWAWRLFRRARPQVDPETAARALFLELTDEDLRTLLCVGDPQAVIVQMTTPLIEAARAPGGD